MSRLAEKYLEDTRREREWPEKTLFRKRAELREFVEIAGDKPVNAYQQEDGVNFKDVQLALPANRKKQPFKKLSLVAAAAKASDLRGRGGTVELLDPITIKDKIGTVSLFFEWAKSRDNSVVNPLAGQRINLRKTKRTGTLGLSTNSTAWFAAPIFTGCRSERSWQEPRQPHTSPIG